VATALRWAHCERRFQRHEWSQIADNPTNRNTKLTSIHLKSARSRSHPYRYSYRRWFCVFLALLFLLGFVVVGSSSLWPSSVGTRSTALGRPPSGYLFLLAPRSSLIIVVVVIGHGLYFLVSISPECFPSVMYVLCRSLAVIRLRRRWPAACGLNEKAVRHISGRTSSKMTRTYSMTEKGYNKIEMNETLYYVVFSFS